MRNPPISLFALACGCLLVLLPSDGRCVQKPIIEVEEIVTRYASANNGAGPLWCYGAPLVVRHGGDVYASVIQTGEDIPPLCNTRWQVWQRHASGWRIALQEPQFRQREPCPLVSLPTVGLFLSSNPSLTAPGTWYRACRPTVIRIDTQSQIGTSEQPIWSEAANFNDHSYRGFAADATSSELLLLNIDTKTSEQFVSLRAATGEWQARDKITFPIRAAYPQVALHDGAAHVMAIGDIQEPNEQWRTLKKELLKREWDYVFRRLFYAYAPDVRHQGFEPPIEIDSVETTGGHIQNLDLHVDELGRAHLLYLKRPHQYPFLRDRFFPDQAMTVSLEYATVHHNQVVQRQTLAQSQMGGGVFEPSYARFHITPNAALLVVMAGTQRHPDEADRFINLIEGIRPKRQRMPLNLEHPFHTFFTNSPRGGSAPSYTLDLFGTADDAPNVRYAAVQIPPSK